ncbi:unnamed protein product [Nezara viridula]|uniref:Neuropeptide n=1 Tax=Nezara viridula TaxID=85310 RepID=A0A9P0MS07_NEZVI|nr:unnamed protein product [Nezara viridula]
MKNVTLLVVAICASLAFIKPAAGSAILYQNELTPGDSDEVGVHAIRSGQHECAPGICCPQYLTCMWGWTKFYCYFNTGKWETGSIPLLDLGNMRNTDLWKPNLDHSKTNLTFFIRLLKVKHKLYDDAIKIYEFTVHFLSLFFVMFECMYV